MFRAGISFTALAGLAAGPLVASSCVAGGAPDGPTGRVAVAVAPLSLPDVVDACYGLSVLNEATETVWSRGSICASDYGDGTSAIAYVGTCDATDDDDDGSADNTVVLTVLDLYGADGPDGDDAPDPLTDWRNPCAPPDGCRLTAPCQANADVPVDFDLTIARAARQGFFDVAVELDDLYCSAKVDCVRSDGDGPIELVLDPATGQRVQTVVFALACTDGSPDGAGSSTHLYLDDLVLDCGGTTYPVDPSGGPGNLYPDGAGAPAPLVQAMVFAGRELLESGGQSADARYWNVALGLNPAFFTAGAPTCTLTTTAAASEGALTDGATPAGTAYPYISVAVPLNTGATIDCTRHGVDEPAPNDGVATAYTGLAADGSEAESFTYVGTPTAAGLDTGPVSSTPPPPSAPTGFVEIAAGTFVMDEGGGDPHTVTLTRSFWMQETEVTQAQYVSVIGYNPSNYQGGSYSTDQPVERASWWDALTYVNALSAAEGLPACYTLTGCSGAASTGNLSCSGVTFAGLDCTGYRLPTEAEWEYAARGGTTGTRYGDLPDIAWYLSNTSYPRAVGTKLPNDYGLYDVIGNIWEWCWDWYAGYPAGADTDPLGPASGSYRVLRGGSHANSSGLNTVVYRLGSKTPGAHESHLGFRPVRTMP